MGRPGAARPYALLSNFFMCRRHSVFEGHSVIDYKLSLTILQFLVNDYILVLGGYPC